MTWQPDERQKWMMERVTNKQEFEQLRCSGMFWEWFPECDGTYKQFIQMKEGYEQGQG